MRKARSDGRIPSSKVVLVNGERRRLWGYGSTEELALADLQTKIDAALPPVVKQIIGREPEGTFGWYCLNIYFPHVAGKGNAWKEQIAWALDTYILPKWRYTPLAEIIRIPVAAWFVELAKTEFKREYRNRKGEITKIVKFHLTRDTLKNIHKVFSAVMSLASVDGLCSNPLPYVEVQTTRKPSTKDFHHPHEARAMIEAAKGTCHHNPIVLMEILGLRLGEACDRSTTDIAEGMTGPVLRVFSKRNKYNVSEPFLKSNGKVSGNYRIVPIPQSLADELLAHSKNGHLTPNELGDDLVYSSFGNLVERACRNGKVKRISPHECRHSANSILANIGCPDDIRESIVGHRNKATNAIYTHFYETTLREWVERAWQSTMAAEDRQQIGVVSQNEEAAQIA